MQGVDEEDCSRIFEEIRSLRVVITFEFNEIFVSRVRLEKSIGMVRLNEIVLLTCCKKCGYEAFVDMGYRSQLV